MPFYLSGRQSNIFMFLFELTIQLLSENEVKRRSYTDADYNE